MKKIACILLTALILTALSVSAVYALPAISGGNGDDRATDATTAIVTTHSEWLTTACPDGYYDPETGEYFYGISPWENELG